ncbi:MAG TPA: LPS assembly protein LptD [Sphingomonas sp.]|nr:LPS assembly protein LptD [Sphingomonas sp.]
MIFVDPFRPTRPFRLMTALPLVLALWASPALAQSVGSADPSAAPAEAGAAGANDKLPPLVRPGAPPPMAVGGSNAPLADNQVAFSADRLDYDTKTQIVTASGDVRMMRQGNRLRADKVVWNRQSGEVRAIGNVAIQNPQGDIAYGQDVELTDTLKDGVVSNLLLVLENGGRLAANKASRKNGVYRMFKAAYTPCDVTNAAGCPKEPLWKITAERVTYDPARHRVSYRNMHLVFLGVPVLWLPGFSHPDGSGQGGTSGLLVPDANYNARNGLELQIPYYFRIAPNRDLTVTPHVFTGVLPMLDAQYRELDSFGAFQIHGYATDSSQTTSNTVSGSKDFRGYLDANGRFQFGPYWTVSGSLRLVTDRTFLHRYDISNDDRLRSVIKAERIDDDSYLSIAGWSFRTLIPGQSQKAQPIALPAIDYRRRIDDPLLGGKITLEANTLSILRIEGQDTERAFASAEWDKRLLTPMGQQITFTALGRADVYHSDQNSLTSTAIYQGEPGWQGRLIGAGAADVQWPFVGSFLGGTQTITPRVQLVGSAPTRNLAIPNEDSRAIDLTDTDLFAINRFPGYDRFEDDSRITYGLQYKLDLPHFSLQSEIGQSYRLAGGSDIDTILPPGTGLDSRLSDIVGRVTIRYGSFVSLTDRLRLDKDTLAVRVHEVDATLGSAQTYLLLGYLRLNRHIDPAIEDLRDNQELRVGGRIAFLTHWSLFGSATIDLTRNTDPLLGPVTNGRFNPVRDRVGIDYEDDCFEFAVTYRRDYTAFGDARTGNTIQLRLAFKNLGR